jgi:hypothetical protein
VIWKNIPNEEMSNVKFRTMQLYPEEIKFKWWKKSTSISDLEAVE